MLKQRMQASSDNGLKQYIESWFSLKSMNIHTQIPAKVISIDYASNSVNVQPLIKTYVTPTQAIPYPQVINVPYKLMVSGGNSGAKITIPVEVDDVGILQFSERDITSWLVGSGNTIEDPVLKDNLSTGATLYAMSFEVGLFNKTTAVDWDPDFIIIQFGAQHIKIPRDQGGNIIINGAQVTPTGNVITAIGTDLDAFKAEYDLHFHKINETPTTPPIVTGV